jgi:hypothetical protein
MSDLDTAQQALQQAFSANPVDGDAEASEQEGQTKLAPAPKQVVKEDAAQIPNQEAKKKRISDQEWQDLQESAKEGKQLKERLLNALMDAPAEVQKEEDVATQVAKLKELVERREWEASRPIVRTEKYASLWSDINADPKTANLTYDQKWKLIQDDADAARSDRLKGDLKAQESDYVTVPIASKGSVQRGSEASSMAQDFLRKAGFTDQQVQDSGVKL